MYNNMSVLNNTDFTHNSGCSGKFYVIWVLPQRFGI